MTQTVTMADYEKISRTVERRVQRLYGSHYECEDAIQEALIRAWTDLSEGQTDYTHIVNRAANWAKSFLFSNRLPTGAPHRDRSGIHKEQGNKRREKIRMFVDEWTSIHGKKPTLKQVESGTGIPTSSVSIHLKVIREENFSVMTKDESNRLDRSSYSMIPLPSGTIKDEGGTRDNGDEWNRKHAMLYSIPTFEPDSDSTIYLTSLFESLEAELKTIATLYYICDWSQYAIADYIGHSQKYVMVRLKKVHEQLRDELS